MAVASFLTLFFFFITVVSEPPDSENKHTVLLLVGGTGDLAAKYLWQGIFNIYHLEKDNISLKEAPEAARIPVNHTFDFLAAGRSRQDKGNVVLNSILSTSVSCDGEAEEAEGDKYSLSKSLCEKRRQEFIDKISYISIQEEEDFSLLCTEIMTKFLSSTMDTKRELILFLAISPSAYETVLQRFNTRCQSLREKKINIKVALEKPFGVDKSSAELMSKKVLSFHTEEELYRVDHYLGKPVVEAILPFRYLNPEIEKILDKDHVDRVEIFMKEKVGVEERVSVYNSLGVLRDIHQNHLTQLLTLIAMDLPSDINVVNNNHENKERLLRQVESVRRHNSLFGQYSNYAELVKSLGSNITQSENLPTFAASVVKINSPRWRSVPFLLVSGKELDSRESFVRVVFKNNFVCVSHCDDGKSEEEGRYTKQLIFHIGHGNVKKPAVLVSKSFSEPVCPENFQESIDPFLFTSKSIYGENLKHFYVCSVLKNTPAYESVFTNILKGRQDNFVSTQQLILSWQVWDYLVSASKKLRIYENSDPKGRLNFLMKESQLEFVHDEDEFLDSVQDETVVTHSEVMHEYAQTPAKFLGNKLVTSHTDHLAFILAREIDKAAKADIQNKGSFHVALSGGSSLIKVFQMLAQSFANVHWHSVHVWQVDERCLPHQDERSNFQVLDRELLRFVDIPYSNIHAMPVYTGGRLCDEELGGAHAYSETLRHTVTNSQFDMIVLGVGTDGHTASLFPASSDLHVDSNTFVVTTEDGPEDTRRRMTLTLPIINKAKRVAVFVTGKHKKDLINQLESAKSVDKFPVLGVNPVNGTLTWYMDYDAYAGVQTE